MNWLRSIFIKNNPEKSTDNQKKTFAPGTEIGYDSALLARFSGHHQTLLKLFGEISQAADDGDFTLLAPSLKRFLRVFEQHVLEENLRFYVYLEKCLQDDDHGEFANDMKQEMNGISRSVRSFIRHHLEFEVTQDNLAKFKQELAGIGFALTDRIDREENSLYTLYLPPTNYAA